MNEQERFIEPHALSARLLAWSELNVNEVDTIMYVFKGHSVSEIYVFLEKFLNLSQRVLRERALIDMHYYAIKFALDHSFSKIQLSAFVSILRSLHRANQETPFENYKFILKYFEDLMICHSLKRPPFCAEIFNQQKAALVIDYIQNSYLKHYRMYKFAFTPQVEMDLRVNYENRTPSPVDSEEDTEQDDNKDVIVAGTNEDQADEEEDIDLDPVELAKREMRSYIRRILEEKAKEAELQQDIDQFVDENIEKRRQESLAKSTSKK